jgi:hypothetical protein
MNGEVAAVGEESWGTFKRIVESWKFITAEK